MLRVSASLLVPVLLVAACGGGDDLKMPIGRTGSAGSDDSSSATTTSRTISDSPTKGVATFYDADGSGNCGFDATPKDLDVVALDRNLYAKSAMCGGCLKVTGPKGDVTVRIVDSCPECAETGANLDLSAEAFAKIAEPKQGKISISYELVSCAVSGNLAYHFKDGSSQWWTAIQIRNSKVPVSKVEYQSGSGWVEMKRQDYNYFIAEKGVGATKSLVVRVTSSDDQVIEDTIAGGPVSNKTISGAKQFE